MILRLMPFTIVAYGLSDTGLIRQNNEDFWTSLPGHRLYVLADGMGGHQAGEVAAREASQFFLSRFEKFFENEVVKHLSRKEIAFEIGKMIKETNNFIFELGQTHELLRGMGTTFCCLFFHEDSVIFAHVGDSRIYRLRHGKIKQLTHDHSLLTELIDLGRVTEEDAKEFLYKNIITRAIGTEPYVEPSVESELIRAQDQFLLCSDGLSDLLTSDEIENILNQQLTVEEKVRALIAEAKQKGGYDNVTVVLTEVKEQNNAKENISR